MLGLLGDLEPMGMDGDGRVLLEAEDTCPDYAANFDGLRGRQLASTPATPVHPLAVPTVINLYEQ